MLDALCSYDVTWDSPSHDASGSMPLGNGDLAVNVWVDPSGDVLLLLAKTDAWDENSLLLKLGRVRIRLSPSPLSAGAIFEQKLRLSSAEITIRLGDARLRVWADANAPVIRVDVDSESDSVVTATVECWRDEPRTIKTQTGDMFRQLGGADPHPTVVHPDQFFDDADSVTWCHHNAAREPDAYAVNMRLQGLGDLVGKLPHPLTGRTFGATVAGDGFEKLDRRSLRSAPRRTHTLTICALTEHPSTPERWRDSVRTLARTHATPDKAAHDAWWRDFWSRSHVIVTSPSKNPVFAEPHYTITRAYILQRFMNACAGRGAQPIKFNGSVFSYGKPDDPDFRRWGGPGFWFQNQRLIYWPMLADGDWESFRVFARTYLDQLHTQRHRTRTYYNHPGAHFPETATFWGAEVSAHYGWTPFHERTTPEAECRYVRYYFCGALELSLMLHTWYEYTQDESIVRDFLLPIASEVIEFYAHHYPRDASGYMRIEPSQSLETWQDATNPTPDVAGLRYLLPRLIALPGVDAERRERWSRLLESVPSIPTTEQHGVRLIAPAERFRMLKNVENPELYCVFPHRLYGLGKPDLALARQTFAARRHVEHTCWHQDDIQAAYLGLTHTAKANITRRASAESHSESRFPAFWNAFHDWIPDMDHGGVLQTAMQAMLLQCEGDQILLFPAWPAEWDVDFKLHAPKQTVVEASLKAGKVVAIKVTPESRASDIVNMLNPVE